MKHLGAYDSWLIGMWWEKTTSLQWLSAKHHQSKWEQHHAMRFALLRYALRFQRIPDAEKQLQIRNFIFTLATWKIAKQNWTSGGWEYPSPMPLVYLMSSFLKVEWSNEVKQILSPIILGWREPQFPSLEVKRFQLQVNDGETFRNHHWMNDDVRVLR